MRRLIRDPLTGLTATIGLAAWLAGLPAVLVWWRHNPLPGQLPSWHRLTALINAHYLDPKVIPNLAAIIGWIAWATVTRTIISDLTARAVHRPPSTRSGYVRLTVCAPVERIREAVARIRGARL